MFDQLHYFSAELQAKISYPKLEDKQASWIESLATAMPCTISLGDPTKDVVEEKLTKGVKPLAGYWMCLAVEDIDAASTLRKLPTFRVEFLRPLEDTYWKDAITNWSVDDPKTLEILGFSCYAGAKYVFD